MRTLDAPSLPAKPPTGGDLLDLEFRVVAIDDFWDFELSLADWRRLNLDRVGVFNP